MYMYNRGQELSTNRYKDSWPINWRRKWQPNPVFLPRKSHGRRSLVGYSPRGRKESDTTERLHYYYTTTKSRFLVTTGKQRYLTSFKSPQCYRHLWQRTRELFTVCWIIKLPLMTLLWSQKLVLSMILSLLWIYSLFLTIGFFCHVNSCLYTPNCHTK